MKKLFLTMVTCGILFFTSCCTPIPEEDRIPVSEAKIVCKINGAYIKKATIGNHEYLYTQYDRGFGICHYEDCKYCKKMKK